MAILIVSCLAMLVFLLYISSLLTPLKTVEKSQYKMRETIEAMKDDEISSKTAVVVAKVMGTFLLIFYCTFYITAACILNQPYFTLVSALFVALSIRSMLLYFKVIEGNLIVKPKWYHKLHTVAGIFYTNYFLVQYYGMHSDSFSNYILGVFIGIILFVLMKLQANKNRKAEEAKEAEKKASEETL